MAQHSQDRASGDFSSPRTTLDDMFSVAYEELRRLASSVKRSDPSATLNPTALVNEAWMKLAAGPAFEAESQLHFKRIAARAMRQVLVEAARRRTADKRDPGTPLAVISFGDAGPEPASSAAELLMLDAALDRLAALQPRQAALVESRFFGGFDMSEISAMLDVSEATLLRDWRAAKAWLAHELSVTRTRTPRGAA